MLKENDNFLEIHELMDREFYEFYKQNRSHQALAIDQYNYFEKAIGGLCNIIKKNSVSCSGGVHIRNFGYFCHIRSKNKRKPTHEKNPLKKHIKKYRHYLWFHPEEDLKGWYLEPSFMKWYKKLDAYYVTPESAHMNYEMRDYNTKISREAKDVKFIK